MFQEENDELSYLIGDFHLIENDIFNETNILDLDFNFDNIIFNDNNLSCCTYPNLTNEFSSFDLLTLNNEETIQSDVNEFSLNVDLILNESEKQIFNEVIEENQNKKFQCKLANDYNNKNESIKPMKNCAHIWELFRDLLKYQSNLVKWINKEEGIFKIIDQNKIADLWGDKKDRKNEMDYDKLSRGIRHSRKKGYFKQIVKNQPYGKKFVYQFGEKAVVNCNWLSSFVKI